MSAASYDRAAELRALDATYAGVRGLVASGVTHVPRIFRVCDQHHDPPQDATVPAGHEPAAIPIIDLGCGDHAAVVAAVRLAAAEWGFFEATGHGVPKAVMSAATDAVRAFHEADGGEGSEKARLYSREPARAVKYHCNFDLFQSPVANWRDTLYLRMAPAPPAAGDLPDSCRRHSDGGFLTILLQDEIGGLQILNEDRWVDVMPTPGAFIVNIGDLLQLISNDGFRSIEHRVLAKNVAPRVPIAYFFSTHIDPASTRMYGPIKELLSDENPPLYKEALASDYIKHYYSIGLDEKTAISHYRL